MDLSTRLTPPDMLAIDCNGRQVSVASSRAPKTTFIADGVTRHERSSSGNFVQSRVTLSNNTLTFTSTGHAEDRINVAFQSIDDGRRMRVTRRIYAEQLSEPIVIQTVYDKISDVVRWDGFAGESQVAAARSPQRTANTTLRTTSGSSEAAALRQSLEAWIAATNRKDIDRQMSFYARELKAYYLSRNTPQSAVRAEKDRAFLSARSIDIRAEEPEIVFQDQGRTAVMRFRKSYRIADRSRTKSGEVIQELRWQRTANGWRIFSERDVRVIR